LGSVDSVDSVAIHSGRGVSRWPPTFAMAGPSSLYWNVLPRKYRMNLFIGAIMWQRGRPRGAGGRGPTCGDPLKVWRATGLP